MSSLVITKLTIIVHTSFPMLSSNFFLQISLLLILGLLQRITAQSPSISILSDTLSTCPGDAATYRCEGSGAVLIWSVSPFSNIVYEAAVNAPGDGAVSGPLVSTLTQESPTIVSTITVVNNQNPELTLICSVGASISSTASAQIIHTVLRKSHLFYQYISIIIKDYAFFFFIEPPVVSPDINLTVINGGTDTGIVGINVTGCDCHNEIEIELHSCDSSDSWRTTKLTGILASFDRSCEPYVDVTVIGRFVTRCNQTGPDGIATVNMNPTPLMTITSTPVITTMQPMPTSTPGSTLMEESIPFYHKGRSSCWCI